MKTLKFISMAAMAAMSFALTSCDDDFEETFDIYLEGYILQNVRYGMQNFTPVFFISSNSTSFPLKEAEMYSPTAVFTMEKNNDYVFRTSGTDYFASPADLSGKYSMTATATNGHLAMKSVTIEYEATDTVGVVDVVSLEYTGSQIKGTVKETSNAKIIGLIVAPYDNGAQPSRYSYYHIPLTTATPLFVNGEWTFSYPFDAATSLGTDKAMVKIFISNGKSIYRESDLEKHLTKTSNSFD